MTNTEDLTFSCYLHISIPPMFGYTKKRFHHSEVYVYYLSVHYVIPTYILDYQIPAPRSIIYSCCGRAVDSEISNSGFQNYRNILIYKSTV